MSDIPKIVVLAGPNGAGKSTSAKSILRGAWKVAEFVNADTIAVGLSAFAPESVGLAAGRVMLKRLRDLAAARMSFAFETTLASRSFAPWLAGLRDEGFEFHLIFLWLPSADAAIERVADRVRRGGHSIPEATIRRRYQAGIANFLKLYQELATSWQIVDNQSTVPSMIAIGSGRRVEEIREPRIWNSILSEVQ